MQEEETEGGRLGRELGKCSDMEALGGKSFKESSLII